MASAKASSPQPAMKIDFSGLDPANPGRNGWADVRSQVMQALESHGWFEAVYEWATLDLRKALFASAMKELFALPLEAKLRNVSDKPFHGYLGQIHYLSYESLAIADVHLPGGVESFTRLLWPDGNPSFSETVSSFSKILAELDRMVLRMVLESLGVEEKQLESQMESDKFLLRVSEYGVATDERRLGLVPHRDKNTIAIVCQNQVDGLEMETKDGEWALALPSPTSVIVIAGDSLRALTNGRTYSPLHRVVGGAETRHSAILFSVPKDDLVIRPLPEVVDDNHPSLFEPFTYAEYVRFCMSETGKKAKCQLDAFCGVGAQLETAA